MSAQYIFEEFNGEEVTKTMLHALDRATHAHPEGPSQLASYSPDALAGAALAAASAPEVQSHVLTEIGRVLSNRESPPPRFSPKALTKILWAFAAAAHSDPEALLWLAEHVAACAEELTAEQLAQCFAAAAELQLEHEPMLMAMSIQLMWRVDQLSARSLGRVAVSCAKLDYRKQPFLDWLASRMSLREDRTLGDVSAMVWAWSKLSVQSVALCRTAALDASKEELTEEEHARLLLAFGTPHLEFPSQGLPRPLFHPSLSGAESVCKPL
ncbi:Nucleotid_trans domain-containing protein [Durusdinium trenchii]|uniref:Nucleotid_trans domain-containing protein n=1 Tax=Durusdinium trenchii TaxID=1381693 RepID=A0ABP0RXH4_9DINO